MFSLRPSGMLESHIGRLRFVYTLSSTCLLGPWLEFWASILKFPGYVSWFRADSGTNRICACLYKCKTLLLPLQRHCRVQPFQISSRAGSILISGGWDFLHPVTKSKKLFLSISQYIFVGGLWLVILFYRASMWPITFAF